MIYKTVKNIFSILRARAGGGQTPPAPRDMAQTVHLTLSHQQQLQCTALAIALIISINTDLSLHTAYPPCSYLSWLYKLSYQLDS